ncbi:MAG: methylated-DNA--[protein]-cysteine S-methyltransferase [Gemmatales bacterium]|nr:methylated-DNA--[protein]-cysteine S-methyltransferase [Gemmatales bacterium]MDW8385653.1 methylated-DNA--[protein]-cysteine S-methyltransferase [Gemmatales bacterium]
MWVRFAEEEEATGLDEQVAAGCRFREAWQRRTLELLERYFSGEMTALDEIPVDYRGLSVFRRRVMEACRAIPSGSTATYRQLAEAVGHPKAARAVGGVMRTNPVPLIVPCHRVIRCDGNLGGYSGPGGVVLKRRLLELESLGRCRSETDSYVCKRFNQDFRGLRR